MLIYAAITATLTVAVVAWWMPRATEEAASSHAPALTADPSPGGGYWPAKAVSRPQAEEPDHLEREDGFPDAELWAHISDPTKSDLPPDVFAELTRLAAAVIRADATGEGREHWPDHWEADRDDVRAEACCTRVEIHASGATSHPRLADRAQAVVVWSGWHAEELALSEVTTVLALARQSNRWLPVR